MRVTTEEKALCRYLLLRERHKIPKDPTGYDLRTVLSELAEIDRGNGFVFGLSLFGDPFSPCVQSAVGCLWEGKFLKYDGQNPHVDLTDRGRSFGADLRFPDSLEKQLPSWLETFKKRFASA